MTGFGFGGSSSTTFGMNPQTTASSFGTYNISYVVFVFLKKTKYSTSKITKKTAKLMYRISV
jgi:hypothetical protein